MKYSAAFIALAAGAVAQPAFTNTAFDVQEGVPFTLTYNGCQGGCSIILQNGPEDDLQDVQELTSSTTGGSFSVTLKDLPTDSYAFKIVNNASGEENYSVQFSYAGTGEPEETDSEDVTTMTTTMAETTTFTSSETPETTETETETETETQTPESSTETPESTMTTVTETPSPTETEDAPDSTDDEESGSEESSGIPAPEAGSGAIGAPLALVAAAVVGLLFVQ